MTKILFVCLGNICRSPMAEFVMREKVRRAGLSGRIEVASAGTSDEELGNPVHPGTRSKLRQMGVPMTARTARPMDRSDYAEYDLLIGMETSNVRSMRRICGGDPEGKIVCFAKPRGRKRSIAELGALYDRLVVHPENQTVCIAHGDCLPEAEALAERLRANHPPKEIMIEMYEPVTGAHVGPGTIALFFLSNPRVREEL